VRVGGAEPGDTPATRLTSYTVLIFSGSIRDTEI
jgi:hypothetical protein